MTGTPQLPSAAVHTLADRIRGPVHVPGTQDYDRERTGFQLLHAHRPALVVGAADAEDVRSTVEFAAAEGLRVAVQATGHGTSSEMDGGLLISTHRMSGVRVDPLRRTAWIEAGATWKQVIEAAAPHGLAPLSGSFPGVGAVSYILGGGVGLLARRYGFAADHVHRIDLVTADGRPCRATAVGDADLFWALRGGGGNFGVVTGMEIELMPVSQLYGGGLFFDLGQAPGVLSAWWRWTASVPAEMTSAVSMLPFPDAPAVPEPLRGRHVAQVQIAYLGSAEEARSLLEPLLEAGACLRDTLRVLPYAESGAVFDEPDQPHAYLSRSVLVRNFDGGQELDRLPELAASAAPVRCVVGLRHLGGALARPPEVANAVGHREANYALGVLSPVGPNETEAVRAAHDKVLQAWSGRSLGRMLNFNFDALTEDEVRAAFAPEDYSRLRELKARHDPQGRLFCNHPIPPVPRD